ncbi:MAG: hypothetical protein HOH43_27325 [Candidatus Latescibacteria bacterium]|nr:hypothetical protein [Candidatus Latescibacterota bacterium]
MAIRPCLATSAEVRPDHIERVKGDTRLGGEVGSVVIEPILHLVARGQTHLGQ